jgi:phosphotransferase system HPr-like phosphotransfer protein
VTKIKKEIIMTEKKIKLTTVNDVVLFVDRVTAFVGDVDLVSGRYIVDAKSQLGVLSLDLSKELTVRIHLPVSDENCGELLSKLEHFFVAQAN